MVAYTVNGISIEYTGEQVVGHTATQSAAGSDSRESSYKVHASYFEEPVEIVVLRDLDLVAVGILVLGCTVTALLRVVTVHRVWKSSIKLYYRLSLSLSFKQRNYLQLDGIIRIMSSGYKVYIQTLACKVSVCILHI